MENHPEKSNEMPVLSIKQHLFSAEIDQLSRQILLAPPARGEHLAYRS